MIATVVACGPLFLFSSHLYRARHRDGAAYHVFARSYVDDFRRKWLVKHSGTEELGTQDLQALNDLGGSFERSERTRLYPFGMATLTRLWFDAFLPMLPLLLITTPISEIGKHVARIVFGLK